MWPDWRDERREGLWRNWQIASLHPEDTSSPPYLWAGTSLHPEDSFSPPWRYLLSTLSVLELLSNVPLIFEDSFSPDLSSLQLVLLSKVWSKSDCDDLISWIFQRLPLYTLQSDNLIWKHGNQPCTASDCLTNSDFTQKRVQLAASICLCHNICKYLDMPMFVNIWRCLYLQKSALSSL